MTDPTTALLSFQQALADEKISPSPGRWNPDLQVLQDEPNGCLRVTHAKIVGTTAQGIVEYFIVQPVGGIPCFQIGYAVAPSFRRQGIATALLRESMEELKRELQSVGLHEYYLEAVVGVQNVASNKIATLLLSTNPDSITDGVSGEPAFQYLKKVS